MIKIVGLDANSGMPRTIHTDGGPISFESKTEDSTHVLTHKHIIIVKRPLADVLNRYKSGQTLE